MELFDKEDIYDNEISPLMQEIITICKKHQIPMVASFTYENSAELGVGRCSTLLNWAETRADPANIQAAKIIKYRHSPELFAVAISKG